MITVLPSELWHVHELAEDMRQRDQEEAKGIGMDPKDALLYTFKHGLMRRTAFVGDTVAAMWGLGGTPLGVVGQPYLVTGRACDTVSPIRFAKIYIKELNSMKSLFPVLENYVHSDYEGAVRMLELAGFDLSEDIPINGTRFKRFTMITV